MVQDPPPKYTVKVYTAGGGKLTLTYDNDKSLDRALRWLKRNDAVDVIYLNGRMLP